MKGGEENGNSVISQVQVPCDECDLYVNLNGTSKLDLKK